MNNEKLNPLKIEMDNSIEFLEKLMKNLWIKNEKQKMT